jgi:hypothetical protein
MASVFTSIGPSPGAKRMLNDGPAKTSTSETLIAIRVLTFGLVRKKLTINKLLDRWLLIWENRVRENSHLWYSQLMKRYVRPTLGESLLVQLRPNSLEDLYTRLPNQGLCGRTIRHVHARLRTALQWAVDSELNSRMLLSK